MIILLSTGKECVNWSIDDNWRTGILATGENILALFSADDVLFTIQDREKRRKSRDSMNLLKYLYKKPVLAQEPHVKDPPRLLRLIALPILLHDTRSVERVQTLGIAPELVHAIR